jgi:hypothetical protein
MILIYYKRNIIAFLFLFSVQSSFSQTIILRPYYGRKWYSSNKNDIVYNNFDPNSLTKINSSRYIIGVSAEYQLKTNSLELYFSSQPTIYKFQSFYNAVGAFSNENEGSYSQFQILYNRYLNFNRINSFKYKVVPILTAGFGVGIVTSQNLLNNSSYNERINGLNNEFIEINSVFKKESSINFSGIIKIGGAVKNKKREIFRLQALYNFGINKAVTNEIDYRFTNSQYSGVVSLKGTYFGIQLSLPIYIKRFNK